MNKFKVGDKVKVTKSSLWQNCVITDCDFELEYPYQLFNLDTNIIGVDKEEALELILSDDMIHTKGAVKSDGGPSGYFDLRNGGTLNDELEHKGDAQWLGDSFHLGNVVKAAWRWGIKDGTTKEYDARKLIYSGARLLMKHSNVATLRKTLQKMLDDPQFQEVKSE